MSSKVFTNKKGRVGREQPTRPVVEESRRAIREAAPSSTHGGNFARPAPLSSTLAPPRQDHYDRQATVEKISRPPNVFSLFFSRTGRSFVTPGKSRRRILIATRRGRRHFRFWHKADANRSRECLLLRVKRTCRVQCEMSAKDPKRTSVASEVGCVSLFVRREDRPMGC